MWSSIVRVVLSVISAAIILFALFLTVFGGGNIPRHEVWVRVIIFFLILLLILNIKPHWSFRKLHQHSYEQLTMKASPQLLDKLVGHHLDDRVIDKYQPLVRLLAGTYKPAVCSNNDIQVITDGQTKFNLLMKDLEEAKESIHMEYFHFGADSGSRQIRDMLIKKAQEGVKVRFLNEDIANLPIIPSYYNEMKRHGVEVVPFTNIAKGLMNFLTRLNYRNHRKIVVIDGKIGYTGGMNVNDHYFKHWRDTHMRITGDAVASLQMLFLDSWIMTGGPLEEDVMQYFPEAEQQKKNILMQVIGDEPGTPWHTIQMAMVTALDLSRDYFYAQTPYFVPTEPILEALKSAALRGVDVRLMVPLKPDMILMGEVSRSYFAECLQAGVKIYERGGEFMHSKTFVSDDYLTCIGTANINHRSMNLDYEDVAYIYDEQMAIQNKNIFLDDMTICHKVSDDDLAGVQWYEKLLQHTLRLFSPFF